MTISFRRPKRSPRPTCPPADRNTELNQRIFFTVVGALCAVCILVPAASATPADARPAAKMDLSKVKAKREVKDAILPPGARIASGKRAVASATFTDGSGRAFNLDTTVPGYDLNPAAAALNSTYHGAEIAKISVHAILLADMRTTCGDAQAIACYRPMAGGQGELWFATDDSDWVHSLIHEYGHHMDNQIGNLAQLGPYGFGKGCTVDSDGTRDWFFSRLLGDNTIDSSKFFCRGTDWEHLVPELYAEDFVVLNGINGWQLSSALPPKPNQLAAMKYDIDNKLLVKTMRFSKKIRHKRFYWKRFTTPVFSLVSVTVKAARGRDFDVVIFPAKSNKLWDKATTNGRTERLIAFVAPGTWDVGIYGFKKTGVAKTEIKLR